MDLIYWDHYYDKILLVNLLIVIALFTSLRWFLGAMTRIDADNELLTKDNPAFGISLAGAVLGITIILSGVMYGGNGQDMPLAVATVILHGTTGLLFLALTRAVFAKITLPSIAIRNEIVKGNIAVAIVDTANTLAAAIIIHAVLVWLTSNTFEGVLALFAAYAISQVILTATTILKINIFGRLNKENSLPEELRKGNVALALRFAGQKIGTAFAITIASNVVVTEVYEVWPVILAWSCVSIVAIVILKLVCLFAEFVILYNVDVNNEVIDQRNIALGFLQAVIYICLGMLLAQI